MRPVAIDVTRNVVYVSVCLSVCLCLCVLVTRMYCAQEPRDLRDVLYQSKYCPTVVQTTQTDRVFMASRFSI